MAHTESKFLAADRSMLRTADVDVFDDVFRQNVRTRDRFLERVQVHSDEIDRFDLMLS